MRAEVIANFALSGAGCSGHYKKGLKLVDPRRTVTARKVLGLTTNPPSNDGGGGSRGDGGSGGGLEV
ncbi:hypothetical protein [Streptomyces mirabilis]